MAVPTRPTPDDFDNISKAFDWLYQWANVLTTGVLTLIGGFLWRASAKITKFESEQEKQATDIAELKRMREAQSAKIETLATKDDLEQATSNITGELRAGMATMAQLVTRTRG
jgi:hypothetical protein